MQPHVHDALGQHSLVDPTSPARSRRRRQHASCARCPLRLDRRTVRCVLCTSARVRMHTHHPHPLI
eukprot:94898-Chlamydomonas_euryale.AAC.1